MHLSTHLCSSLLLDSMLLCAAMLPPVRLRLPKAAYSEVLPLESRFRGIADRHGRPCRRWHWKAPKFIAISTIST
uniref:Secreted protein n=1 Tax=Setaria viridis TaxID=4556 RepID=A0A4U6T946_SETVI|nr:hypothetical protein SEVIR_9G484675v2 [Setaria viridis]